MVGIKTLLRSVAPRSVFGAYHWGVSALAAAAYGWPARQLTVIGVTGTKGKSTTCGMVHHILQRSGIRAGLISTAEFAVGDERWLNDLKMTTPSRRTLQKLLRRMVRAGCTHVVLETSSEALAQWRHFGIPYAVVVFTNLAPEHLEAHGGYRAYRAAKGQLFRSLGGRGAAVVNLDDDEAEYFLKFPAREKIGFTLHGAASEAVTETLNATLGQIDSRQADFIVNSIVAELKVGGVFNVANALAALAAAGALGLPLERAVAALKSYGGTPGRLEFIAAGQPYRVVVDYAHTTGSLEALYRTLAPEGTLIAVLGSCGGGRDQAKRAPLGRLAATYSRAVVVTNEDPYDENPESIMAEVARGVRDAGGREGENLWIEPERRNAIRRAFALARVGDTVVITGKGAEQWLCVAGGVKVPWDDRTVAREEIIKCSTKDR